jgi:hypothetical protein
MLSLGFVSEQSTGTQGEVRRIFGENAIVSPILVRHTAAAFQRRGRYFGSTPMNDEDELEDESAEGDDVWDDEARATLRETLEWVIRGELRMAKNGPDEILETCRAVYIHDTCPEEEWETFDQFAARTLNRTADRLTAEKLGWPEETDCDRLDRVEASLRESGIVLWQLSPCCDTCTMAEMGDRVAAVDARHPGFRDHLRGYAFFIDQNVPEELSEGTEISVFLGYGWASPDRSEVSPEEYESHALGIGREICECLRAEGFEPDWDGSFSRKIGVTLNWQRRHLLD